MLVCVYVRYDGEFFELLAALPSISFSYSSSGRCDAALGYFFSYILLFALIDDALLRFGASLDACLLADVTQPLRDDLWTFAVNLLIRLRRKYETKQLHFVAFFCAVFEVADTSIEFHDFMKL